MLCIWAMVFALFSFHAFAVDDVESTAEAVIVIPADPVPAEAVSDFIPPEAVSGSIPAEAAPDSVPIEVATDPTSVEVVTDPAPVEDAAGPSSVEGTPDHAPFEDAPGLVTTEPAIPEVPTEDTADLSGSAPEEVPDSANTEEKPAPSAEYAAGEEQPTSERPEAGKSPEAGEKSTCPDEPGLLTQTAHETLNDEKELTVTIKGLSDESKEKILTMIEGGIDIILDYYPTTGSMILEAPDLIDAEKYMVYDYDAELCWAGTAANMLWTSNYAQNAINPTTGSYFQSEDEVFDYFRKTFKDESGNANAAFSLFFYGSENHPADYSATWWMKDPEQEIAPLLPDEEDHHPYGYNTLPSDEDYYEMFESVRDTSIGLVIHGVEKGTEGVYTDLSHSVTLSGVVIDEKEEDPEKRYKAVLIANSDDSYPGHYYEDGVPEEEKAAAAAAAANRYTLFPLSRIYFEHIGNCWSIPYNYNPFSNTAYIISAFAWLRDKVISQPDDDSGEDTPPEKPDEPVVPEDDSRAPVSDGTHEQHNGWQQHDRQDLPDDNVRKEPYDFSEIRKKMQTHDWIVYSPADWIYHSTPDERNDKEEPDGSFLVFVRTSPDNLLNVYLDGERISAHHGDFSLTDGKNGTFLMLFREEFMLKLASGEHTLRMQLADYGEVTAIITVT